MMFNVTTAILIEATLSLFGVLNIDMSREMMIHTAETVGHPGSAMEVLWSWLPLGLAIILCAPHSTLWEEISMKLRVSGRKR